ncbi:Rha family transcriptional regulator [Clostridium sp. DSM 100503]|uniref:Rha family transcriptional regulator n=1 Tax=Clostridium sp. DSM 100503 TaxID=2963282 RepID=UPI002149E490|nr:Rha family transcriptional regulator [Clostridium sp. DSM 100503]MCR1953146.1 Rha family transcriptional regulator [Clostridium sp. DSM 100503]
MNKQIVNISNQEGQLVVTSRQISEDFKKRNSHVVEAIENKIKSLTAENSEVEIEKLFIPTTYIHNGNEYKEYLLTRDGFTFIVMGFTGAKADAWKLKYIEAFNKMEETIKSKSKSVKVDNSLKEKEIEARYNNSLVRKANVLLKMAKDNPLITDEYKKVLQSKATEIITGQAILPLPVAERKTYSATDIGKELGISKNKVGSLANKHNLKTDEYGKLFHDKSKYSNKEVESFRYYDNVIPVLAEILSDEKAS